MESSYCQQAVTFSFSFFGLQLTVPGPLTLWPTPPPLVLSTPLVLLGALFHTPGAIFVNGLLNIRKWLSLVYHSTQCLAPDQSQPETIAICSSESGMRSCSIDDSFIMQHIKQL